MRTLKVNNSKIVGIQNAKFSVYYFSMKCSNLHQCTFKGLYPPDFFKKIFFDCLMFFGTLNYGESPYVIYFCCLELFMLLFFITKLTVQKNIPQQRTQQRVLPVLSPNITQENLVFSMVKNPVKLRVTKSRKNLDKQDKIDLEKQTLSSGLQNR